MKIEGNSLTEDQITALVEKKRVVGSKKDALEVLNAIEIFESLHQYDPHSEKSFFKAHQRLMKNLVDDAGKYRKQGVGVVKGSKVEHLALPHENVPFLMKDLFHYLKESKEIELIKSCVFHYEMEFIHPFFGGNGRMGRLWQTLILMNAFSVFEFFPFGTLISNDQDKYYKALAESDKAGNSTAFIVYMLGVINFSLHQLLDLNNRNLNVNDRLEYFMSLHKESFSRKNYMDVFKDISTSTASRDLKKGLELNLFIKTGEKNKTRYIVFPLQKENF